MSFKWKQVGSVKFWYSQRKVKGYHFAASPDACKAILDLIPLLFEHPAPQQQTLVIDVVPEKAPHRRERHGKLNDSPALAKLKLDHRPALAGNFTLAPDAISFSTAGLKQFEGSIRALKAGDGDWALWSSDSDANAEPLWFCWW